MIRRARHQGTLTRLLRQFPVVGLLGPRQVGKTTLAGHLATASPGPVTRFDLERDADVGKLADPELALGGLRGLVILDEIQRRPDLFRALRVLADRPGRPARFLVLGSSSPALLRQTAETLAGRIAYHELTPLDLDETGSHQLNRLWLRGGFPSSFLARTDAGSHEWRRQFVATFAERDVLNLGTTTTPPALRRFWAMLAHYHGQIWNAAEFARAFAVSDTTARRHLDLLAGAFLVRVMQPWFENIGKRQVKSPKVYVADTGLLHTLLGVEDRDALEDHPKVGASWEGLAVMTTVRMLEARADECYFWATHTGAELDLLFVRGRLRIGIEAKRTTTPRLTKSMQIALKDLHLDRLVVLHAGSDRFPLAPRVFAVPLAKLTLSDLR